MATHSSILVWKIPWTEEPGGLQSMRSQSQTWLSIYAQVLWATPTTLCESAKPTEILSNLFVITEIVGELCANIWPPLLWGLIISVDINDPMSVTAFRTISPDPEPPLDFLVLLISSYTRSFLMTWCVLRALPWHTILWKIFLICVIFLLTLFINLFIPLLPPSWAAQTSYLAQHWPSLSSDL